MKLYKFKEQTGRRQALAPEQNPDGLPEGAWLAIGEININREDGPRIGANSEDIIDAIERDGIFIWPVEDNA
ncbi:hypothetical protein [Novosphingobium album (ex Liu et al. 2023)]|uniref:Uncharacterized protein n=1 Tax=Novosphingobium album (ex Liu et al. 2023) TaxID=3031130 RepID=A0ABT5WJA9_9SPHN|nr:hypothetical protein [Novosphingobium album (ex Liu et al. 2023)]MDE8650134.1 hypothetical protein [Novosphingobium album (ex Liu et al. 2023)]